jgi:hypothetical protein
MTPSVELELKIYRYAEFVGQARWRFADIPNLSSMHQFGDWQVVADAFHDLYARGFLNLRQHDHQLLRWREYDGSDQGFFQRNFEIRVTFAGRKYFESLEAQAAEENRVDMMPVTRLLESAKHKATMRELREAQLDLLKRPDPDITGAIQHSMAALECTAKLISGSDRGTLGDVLRQRKLPLVTTLNELLEKAWAFSSDRARHVADAKPISYRDAELVLGLAEAMIVYLLRSPEPETERSS